MRSWRRGIKEMDLILGPFSDSALRDLSEGEFVLYEALLDENDQDLYQWFSGQVSAPEAYGALIDTIKSAGRYTASN